jgi:hypothetical protein
MLSHLRSTKYILYKSLPSVIPPLLIISIVSGLMITPVKVEEVLMLLGHFMEVEAIQMMMRLVFALFV